MKQTYEHLSVIYYTPMKELLRNSKNMSPEDVAKAKKRLMDKRSKFLANLRKKKQEEHAQKSSSS